MPLEAPLYFPFPAPRPFLAPALFPAIVTLKSIDKQLIGQVAAKIRSLRKPEPYKGKGIKFVGEQLRRKAGKSANAK